MTPADLDALAEMLEEATPATWRHERDIKPEYEDGLSDGVIVAQPGHYSVARTYEHGRRTLEDARAIVALRNAAPNLLALARDGMRLREALAPLLDQHHRILDNFADDDAEAKADALAVEIVRRMHVALKCCVDARHLTKGDRVMAKWNGLCRAGLHGLDHQGQACDLCLAKPIKGTTAGVEWSVERDVGGGMMVKVDGVVCGFITGAGHADKCVNHAHAKLAAYRAARRAMRPVVGWVVRETFRGRAFWLDSRGLWSNERRFARVFTSRTDASDARLDRAGAQGTRVRLVRVRAK